MLPLAFGFGAPQDMLIILLFTVFLLPTIFWVVELIDIARRDFTDPNMKMIWFLIVFFTHFIGSLVYYFVGKKQGTLRT